MIENEISSIVIGEAIQIHQILGPGLFESVYEECLCHRLIKKGLSVQRQKFIPLVFEEVRLNCEFRCDMLVEDKVIIEIKSVEEVHDIHLAQVLTYLRMMDLKLGLLLNFNVLRLRNGIRRVVNRL